MTGKEIVDNVEQAIKNGTLEELLTKRPADGFTYVEYLGLNKKTIDIKIEKVVLTLSYLLGKK